MSQPRVSMALGRAAFAGMSTRTEIIAAMMAVMGYWRRWKSSFRLTFILDRPISKGIFTACRSDGTNGL